MEREDGGPEKNGLLRGILDRAISDIEGLCLGIRDTEQRLLRAVSLYVEMRGLEPALRARERRREK